MQDSRGITSVILNEREVVIPTDDKNFKYPHERQHLWEVCARIDELVKAKRLEEDSEDKPPGKM